MVAVDISESDLKEFAKATPDFDTFLEELKKNPSFEVEFTETLGARVRYHGDDESLEPNGT